MRFKRGPRGYKPGDSYVYCDICGHKYRASETKMQWDGLRTCYNHNEVKPPIYFTPKTYPNEGHTIPNARPRPSTRDIDPTLPPDPDSL